MIMSPTPTPIDTTAASVAGAENRIKHNVFRGPRALHDYYNPDLNPPLPLIELPDTLNPFAKDGVRIYAKMMSCLPANNVKALPALNMLEHAGLDKGAVDGYLDAKHSKETIATPDTDARTIVEYSSGSTVISLSIISRIFGISDVRAYLSNKTSDAKLKMMRFFGLDLTLFGGPSQPEPLDPRGGIHAAVEEGHKAGHYNPNQYENPNNWGAHVRWTGKQIFTQLPEIDIFCAGMGTSGTMTGTGLCLKSLKPSIINIGVCTTPGDRVPGPRSEALLEPVTFPWREAVDVVQWVGSTDSYRLSMQLSRMGIVCGPSSGFNLMGLYDYLKKCKREGLLEGVRKSSSHGGDGEIHAVFICCDLPYQYLSEYFEKLPAESFPPIHNENLVGVDKYRYDEAWEILPSVLCARLYRPASTSALKSASSAKAKIALAVAEGRAETIVPSLSKYSQRTQSPDRAPAPFSRSTSSDSSISSSLRSSSSTTGESESESGTSLEVDVELERKTDDTTDPSDPTESPLRLSSDCVIIDLRKAPDVALERMPGALSLPLASLGRETASPFADSATLVRQWTELEAIFNADVNNSTVDSPSPASILVQSLAEAGRYVVIVCYDGDTSRVASSVLRNKGVKAHAVRGGFERWTAESWPVIRDAGAAVQIRIAGA